MKKLIAILTIAIVLVGVVFATDPVRTDSNGTSIIDVRTSIGEQFPEYQLKAIDITANTGTLTTPIAVKDSDNGLVTIDTNDLLKASVAVTFEINQIANSRTSVGYDLSVKATDLVLNVTTDQGTAPKASPAVDEKFQVSLTTSFATTDTDDDLLTITPITATTGNFADTDGGFNVQYLDGKFVNVETETQGSIKQIGTFTYTWAKNQAAKVGDYTATVTLVVTAK